MTITPTEEQLAILSAVKSDPRSLIISALAGAAKTTTLVMAANAMTPVPTFCGAFNKRIADEMGKRMPSFITCSTMNSIGHRVWGQTVQRKLSLNTDKGYEILSTIADKSRPESKKAIGGSFASILRATRSAKASGYIPPKFTSMGQALVSQEEFLVSFAAQSDVEMDGFFFDILDQALEHSIAQAFEGKIDFDDQIYMSTLFGGTYPKYDTVMVDEAQDLSPLNHVTIRKMVGRRLIAVGDPNQAIYAFRGADTSSMDKLRKEFDARELQLSTSFRCPIEVVKRAQTRVPHMRWPEWAKEGKVDRLGEWGAKDVPDGATILCRNNAPLFKIGMRLIRAGRGVKIVGAEIGKGLVKIMRDLGPRETLSVDAHKLLSTWEEDQIKKAHEARKASIRDRAECIRVFLDFGNTLEECIAYAEMLFNSAGSINLMTGHKAKGGEWDVVFHLDPFLIPSKWAREAAENGDNAQMEQELNLKYVIETRSKDTLYLVTSEDFR